MAEIEAFVYLTEEAARHLPEEFPFGARHGRITRRIDAGTSPFSTTAG
ncbi:hypothetical protein ACWDO0_34355 [Nocardia rhamnosiphila]